jgi:hypothetical protein
MPKQYFCKMLKGDVACGEIDPTKFPKGRYTACKDCRYTYVKNYNTNKLKILPIPKLPKEEEKSLREMIESMKNELDYIKMVLQNHNLI